MVGFFTEVLGFLKSSSDQVTSLGTLGLFIVACLALFAYRNEQRHQMRLNLRRQAIEDYVEIMAKCRDFCERTFLTFGNYKNRKNVMLLKSKLDDFYEKLQDYKVIAHARLGLWSVLMPRSINDAVVMLYLEMDMLGTNCRELIDKIDRGEGVVLADLEKILNANNSVQKIVDSIVDKLRSELLFLI